MAINGIGAPRRKECVPKPCVQCLQEWTPQPHEHRCKRCGPCRNADQKDHWVKCPGCGMGMHLRPSAYWQRYHANDWVCGQCKQGAERRELSAKNEIREIPVPCGKITPAREMTRCTGFNPVGDADGCPHYEACMDKAAKTQWKGFTASSGRRITKEWKYVDDFAEFFEVLPGKKLGYK